MRNRLGSIAALSISFPGRLVQPESSPLRIADRNGFMELNYILLWLAGVSCGVNLLLAVLSKADRVRGWIGLLAGLLVLLALGWQFFPDYAGYAVGSLWVLFVVLPGVGMRVVGRLLARRRYRLAMALSRVLGWLHPFDGWHEQAEIVHILQLLHQGRSDEASAALTRLRTLDSPLGRMAVVLETQQTGNWQGLLDWLWTPRSGGGLMRDEQLIGGELQALGELGRRRQMLHLLQGLSDRRGRLRLPSSNTLRMKVLALCGRVEPVDQLLGALVTELPRDVREFWRLTARQVAGLPGVKADFESLLPKASPHLMSAIRRRIDEPLTVLREDELDPRSRWLVDELSQIVAHEARFAVLSSTAWRIPYATYLIGLVLIAVFLLEVRGGSTDLSNLINLGALVIPVEATAGEGWRRITAGFLHFGWLHLLLNLCGLLLFGPRLERAWGHGWMLACYLLTTILSVALVPAFVQPPPDQPIIVLVGASGGVMGLLGAMIGHLLVGVWSGRSAVVNRQLGSLLMIVCLQTAFDMSTPNVSFACHALGLATGLLFALFVGLRTAPLSNGQTLPLVNDDRPGGRMG